MENKSYLFNTGFNQNFDIIENCKIISPPYIQGYKGDKFFVKKRDGIVLDTNLQGNAKSGVIYSDLVDEYIIFLIDNNIVKIDGTEMFTGIDADKLHQVELVGNKLDNGICNSGTATTMTDNGKTWEVNEFAGKYIYLEDGTGAGDYQPIIGNDATTITVAGFTAGLSPDNTTVYRIYNEIVNTFGYSDNTLKKSYFFDGLEMAEVKTISFNSDTTVNTLNAEFANRRWFTDDNKRLYYSFEGQPLIIEGFLNTFGGKIVQIKEWGDYLVVFQSKKISVVKKEIDNNGTTYFTIKELISTSIYDKNSVLVYNSGLYFIGGDKHMYSLNIDISSDDIKGEMVLQTALIDPYIVRLEHGDNYESYTSEFNDGFAFGFTYDGLTTEFYYSKIYEGWLTNKYMTAINHIDVLKGDKYIFLQDGIGRETENEKDNGVAFEQRIGFSMGDDTSYVTKHIKAYKTLFGKSTLGMECKMIINAFTSYKDEIYETTFESTKYIADQNIDPHTIGDVELGSSSLGGQDSRYFVLSPVGIVMNWYNKEAYIFNVVLTDGASGIGFTYGGTHVLYETKNPLTHGLENII